MQIAFKDANNGLISDGNATNLQRTTDGVYLDECYIYGKQFMITVYVMLRVQPGFITALVTEVHLIVWMVERLG